MAAFVRVLPDGSWVHGDDSSSSVRVLPSGDWLQVAAAGGATTGALPIVGRGPGMALAGNGGGLAGNAGAAA